MKAQNIFLKVTMLHYKLCVELYIHYNITEFNFSVKLKQEKRNSDLSVDNLTNNRNVGYKVISILLLVVSM